MWTESYADEYVIERLYCVCQGEGSGGGPGVDAAVERQAGGAQQEGATRYAHIQSSS